jgi:hypothetical protein
MEAHVEGGHGGTPVALHRDPEEMMMFDRVQLYIGAALLGVFELVVFVVRAVAH